MPVEVSNIPTISILHNTVLYAANTTFLCEIVCVLEKKPLNCIVSMLIALKYSV